MFNSYWELCFLLLFRTLNKSHSYWRVCGQYVRLRYGLHLSTGSSVVDVIDGLFWTEIREFRCTDVSIAIRLLSSWSSRYLRLSSFLSRAQPKILHRKFSFAAPLRYARIEVVPQTVRNSKRMEPPETAKLLEGCMEIHWKEPYLSHYRRRWCAWELRLNFLQTKLYLWVEERFSSFLGTASAGNESWRFSSKSRH